MTINTLLQERPIVILVYISIVLLGILFGSFLNVIIYRIPRGEEFVKTPSHCLSCGHKLSWYDNIPLISWLMLKGKCRYCKTRISVQYPIIEASNGLLWLLIILINSVSIDSLLICALCSGLLAMSVIDWRTYEIANGFHIYIIILALIRIVINHQNWLNYVIGFFAVSIFLFLIYVVSNGSAIGGGDVKLMAVCGLFLGWQHILLTLFLGCIVGSCIHLIRMKIFNASNVLAMGPYLAIGVLLSSLFGETIMSWYLSLFI